MITRLRVQGFKNLRDVDVAFGPLTCVAGPNGVGKSNLFDALTFLHFLSTSSIDHAAARVRDPDGTSGQVEHLFFQGARGRATRMLFQVEFIAPDPIKDDFGRTTRPSATFLRYQVALSLGEDSAGSRLVLEREHLDYVKVGEAQRALGFDTSREYRKRLVRTNRTKPFIQTNDGVIAVSQDKGFETPESEQYSGGGRPFLVPAKGSPKTVLANTTSKDQPTILAAKREFQQLMFLQLEPSSLRRPNDFAAKPVLTPTGENLPAVLDRIQQGARLANDLAELTPDVREVYVDRDEGRRLLTLWVRGKHGLKHPARSLSDGTLRFLALATLQVDPEAPRVICLEEPENGVHPSRIPAMVRLLENTSVNPMEDVTGENPLRQVLFNTHSPLVVQQLPEDSIVVADSVEGDQGTETRFLALPGTWRTKRDRKSDWPPMAAEALGNLIRYLGGVPSSELRLGGYVEKVRRSWQPQLPIPPRVP